MPNDEKQQSIRIGTFKKIAERIQNTSNSLYRSTYYSTPDNNQQLKAISDEINASIKSIMDVNTNNIGEPNISKLYERLLLTAQSDKGTITEFEKIFGDNEFVNNLTSTYMDNRWVKAVDQEIDDILKYMPKLREALMIIRDNVLSADSFSKDFLNIENDAPTDASTEQFARNIADLKEKYSLLKMTTDIHDHTSTYGEEYIYCVPYTKAIQRLMDRKDSIKSVVVKTNTNENAVIITEQGLESTIIEPSDSKYKIDDNFNYNIVIENGYISSIINAEKDARDYYMSIKEQSLSEQFFLDKEPINEDVMDINRTYTYANTFNQDLEANKKLPVHHKFDSTLSDSLLLPDMDDTTSDGLIKNNKPAEKIKNMNGCIVKRLKRDRITPIILNDICLGYYYFEFDEAMSLFEDRNTTTGMVNTITGLRSNGRSEAFDSLSHKEELLKSIAANLADKIDSKFINANQDLKKEIYYILKYNDAYGMDDTNPNNIRVSYIPPEDIHHFYFNLDEDTKRGLSDLNLSLIPAKLWVAIYITNCLAIMTRGMDKRVYYVRQSVESNISKTLLKTINEIKKSNFGIRQIENINNVLNITGRFNDYIIPKGSDGQSPVDFEVMQGQNIEIKTELLNLLEESAINVIGVPLELIQSRQSPDYAMQLTMSSSKFLRFVYSRQSDFQTQLSRLITKIYNIEYNTSETVKVTLPPPLFINVTNTNQLIVNTNDYCENISNIIMADQQDDVLKAKFAKKLKIYYLGSYLNMDVINKILDEAKQDSTVDTVSNPENLEGE